MKLKSQSSMEFLTIFGISMVMIIILSGVFFSYSKGAKEDLNLKQIEKFSNEIIRNVEKIYFLGAGNRVTVKTVFPDGINNFTIRHTNISDPNNLGQFIQYDSLNISYIDSSEYVSSYFETREFYIRFNCTKCYNTPNINGNWNSYYNISAFNKGAKQIRVESIGDWVSIDFYQGE